MGKCSKCTIKVLQQDVSDCHNCKDKDGLKSFFKKAIIKPIEETVYWQVLQSVEYFMEQSGIRKYCSALCRGNCCGGCPDKLKMKCWEVGATRVLRCSIFACGDLHYKLNGNEDTQKSFKVLSRLTADASHCGLEFYKHDKPTSIQNYITDVDFSILRDEQEIKLVRGILEPMFKSGYSLRQEKEINRVEYELQRHKDKAKRYTEELERLKSELEKLKSKKVEV